MSPDPQASPGPGATTPTRPVPPSAWAPDPRWGPCGWLVLDLRRPVGSMGMVAPRVTIDGHPVGVGWGRSTVPVPAGPRTVAAACQYLFTYGRAVLPVDVAPGAVAEVFYSAPLVTLAAGAIGRVPQPRPARAAFAVVVGLGGLLLLLAVLGVVLPALYP